jgi:hypothetical protein
MSLTGVSVLARISGTRTGTASIPFVVNDLENEFVRRVSLPYFIFFLITVDYGMRSGFSAAKHSRWASLQESADGAN